MGVVLVVASTTTVEGFTPASRQLVQGGRPATTTQLQKSIFDAISDMDLWAPDKDANTVGVRIFIGCPQVHIRDGIKYRFLKLCRRGRTSSLNELTGGRCESLHRSSRGNNEDNSSSGDGSN